MGIALAVGALLGVRAAGGSVAFWAIIVISLAAMLAIALPHVARPIIASFIIGCMIGTFCGYWRAPDAPPPLPETLPATLSAQVVDDPFAIPSGLYATILWVADDGTTYRSPIYLPIAPAPQRGDAVTVRLATAAPQPLNPLAADAVVITKRATGLGGLRNTIRAETAQRLNTTVQGSTAALALGLLIGDDSGLTGTQRESLRAAGLSHITAVSGWNVAVVVAAIAALFAALRLHGLPWTIFQLAGVAAFVWIVGPDPPVARAALMCLAVTAARTLGRPAHSITLLALTAAVMACISPGLLGTVSFQLTLAATAGLLIAGIYKAESDDPLSHATRVVLTAVLAGLATAPILAAEFGTLSLIGIPANIVLSPVIVFASFASLAAVLLAPLPLLGVLAGSIAWLPNALTLWSAEQLASVPYGYLGFEPLSNAARAAITIVMLAFAGLLTPEGKLLRRRLIAWADTSPGPCAASLAGGAVALLLCIATL